MGSLSILTIDDNDSIRLSIASYLEDMGYNVFEADCGEDGINIIEKEHIDVILTDTHMPGLSGIDILKYVNENCPDTPTIVISGAGEIRFVVEALREGAWDYITKPIEDLGFLTHTVDKVIKRMNLIRENRERDKELEDKNNVLNESLDLLKRTQKQLVESEKMASLGYMVNGVAHEINTPLGVCMTSSSYLKEQVEIIDILSQDNKMKLSDFNNYISKTRELINIIFSSLQSMSNLVTNFKQLSMNPGDINLHKFNLNETISSVLLFAVSSYPDMEVEVNVSKENIYIYSYPEVINRIFFKLVENSIIHGFRDSRDGRIDVCISLDDGSVHITLKNNGKLIPEDLIDKIFDPFFTENKKDGTGLGLSIVHNLVTFTLRGSISCRNMDDGVCFFISFPIIEG